MILCIRAPIHGWENAACLLVPCRQVKCDLIINELRNHNEAPAYQAIKLNLPGQQVASRGTGNYAAVKKGSTATVYCDSWAMNRGCELLMGKISLNELSHHFPLINNIGNSFSEIFTTPEVHENIAFKLLTVKTKNLSHNTLSLELFSTIPPGICWIQLNLRKGLNHTTRHAIIVNIIKPCNSAFAQEDYADMLEDNREYVSIAQKMDADVAIAVKSRDHILK